MAFQQYGIPNQDMGLDDDERKRRALLAAGIVTGMPFEQVLSNYATDRIGQVQQGMDRAQQIMTNPQQALQNRLLPVAPQQAQAPIQMASAATVPTDVQRQPVAPVDLTQQQEEERRRLLQQQQMPQAQVPAPQQQMPQAQVPAPQQQMPVAQTTPQPMEQPAWVKQLMEAKSDPRKLMRFAGSEDTPKDVSDLAIEIVGRVNRGQMSMEDAQAKIQNMLTGDKQATSDVLRDIRKPEGSFIKALLFARLGLNELAQQEQKKLQGDSVEYAQATLDGKQYLVERNNQGLIQRAWDNEGKRVSQDTIPQLLAGAQKPGGQRYTFTGEPRVVKLPNGETVEIRQRADSVTGTIQNVIIGGPRSGQVLSESAAGGTPLSLQSALTRMDYGLVTDLQKKHGSNVLDALAEFQKLKGPLNDTDRQQFLQLYGYSTTVPGQQVQRNVPEPPQMARTPLVGTSTPVPQQQTQFPNVVQPRGPVAPAPARAQLPSVAAPGGALSTPIGQLQSQQRVGERAATERIQTQEEAVRAQQKPPAEARGKVEAREVNNQAFADNTYSLIRPLHDLIKQSTGSGIGAGVDKLAGAIGASPKGAQAIAELNILSGIILNNVPRFEGPQSDRDVAEYMRQAGSLNDATQPVKTRLAALNAIVTLLKKYDKAGRNDWTFGQKQSGNVSTLPDGRTITKID